MYVYDPKTKVTKHLGDLAEAAGEKGANAVAQGKSHVSFAESNGKLYFATHLGFYAIIDGMEKPGVPSKMKPYPGGHFLSYDIATGKFESLAVAPRNEGIITFAMDTKRQRLYGLTWPTGRLIRYDIPAKQLKDVGPVSEQGESGKGATFRTICRSISVNPEDGAAYFSTSDGLIHRYDYATKAVATITTDDLKKDYLASTIPPARRPYGLQLAPDLLVRPRQAMLHGVHGNSGYLFRYLAATGQVEVSATTSPAKTPSAAACSTNLATAILLVQRWLFLFFPHCAKQYKPQHLIVSNVWQSYSQCRCHHR